MHEALKNIPQVSKVIDRFKNSYPEGFIKSVAREVLEEIRREILKGKSFSREEIYKRIERELERKKENSLKKVINATGVIINTNLGRVPLSEKAIEHIIEVARGYSNLEYELEEGKRGKRTKHIEKLLCELTSSEASFVVNNNAGAVFLILNTLACGKEVIVSRGELVEIGGSFRIPDIMRASGSVLKEVGTTNKTRIEDYERAVTENTVMLLKVHKSNFYMEGFVEEVSLEEIVNLARKKGLISYFDGGSGLIVELERFGISSSEISLKRAMEIGVDLASGSGDKLLGGPQAGIIVGKKELIERIKRNPLSRALRVDKLTLAGLESTLRLYLEGKYDEIPVIRMLTESLESIKKRAKKLKRALKRKFKNLKVEVIKDVAKPGGGSLPELELPTYCVSVEAENLKAHELHRLLRNSKPPLIGRIKEDRFLIDMRTVSEEEIKEIIKSISHALSF